MNAARCGRTASGRNSGLARWQAPRRVRSSVVDRLVFGVPVGGQRRRPVGVGSTGQQPRLPPWHGRRTVPDRGREYRERPRKHANPCERLQRLRGGVNYSKSLISGAYRRAGPVVCKSVIRGFESHSGLSRHILSSLRLSSRVNCFSLTHPEPSLCIIGRHAGIYRLFSGVRLRETSCVRSVQTDPNTLYRGHLGTVGNALRPTC